ncbi:MAG TPA: PD-(D/E)XK nuclease family protein [Pirellulales bacterium]|nr:PD-(D/E)XK nuclease family protein [Pirellulales bacterium]
MIGIPLLDRKAQADPRKRDYLSWSAVAAYQRCPLSYYFRYVVGLPEDTVSSSLVFGGAVHRAVEHHFKELMTGAEPPSLGALLGEYDAGWNERDLASVRFGKDESRDDRAALARRMLAAFQASTFAQPAGLVLGVEEELRGSVAPGCPDLLGRLDLIVESADAVTITDLKTARSRWSQEQVDESAGSYCSTTSWLAASPRASGYGCNSPY